MPQAKQIWQLPRLPACPLPRSASAIYVIYPAEISHVYSHTHTHGSPGSDELECAEQLRAAAFCVPGVELYLAFVRGRDLGGRHLFGDGIDVTSALGVDGGPRWRY